MIPSQHFSPLSSRKGGVSGWRMVLKKERGRRLVPKKEREWIMVSKEENGRGMVPKGENQVEAGP